MSRRDFDIVQVWQALIEEDEHLAYLVGQRENSFGYFRGDYSFFTRFHGNQKLRTLCPGIWAFHDELELQAETLGAARDNTRLFSENHQEAK